MRTLDDPGPAARPDIRTLDDPEPPPAPAPPVEQPPPAKRGLWARIARAIDWLMP